MIGGFCELLRASVMVSGLGASLELDLTLGLLLDLLFLRLLSISISEVLSHRNNDGSAF